MMPGTSEGMITQSSTYNADLDFSGTTVQFNLNPGTTAALAQIGVRDNSNVVMQAYGDMAVVQPGWNQTNAYFKGEDNNINIGLGFGPALTIFNINIQGYTVIRVK
jgi:hypothetical protein